MSTASGPHRGTLHATLHEVEPGLYKASYSGEMNPEDSDARDFPDAHIGTDAEGVRQWVQEMATRLGYDQVIWDPTDPA